MKNKLLPIIFVLFSLNLLSCRFYNTNSVGSKNTQINQSKKKWKLIFEDSFNNDGEFDKSKWSYSPRWHPAWAKFLTEGKDYVNQENGMLVLRMDNKVIKDDPIQYHSGGIQTAQKFSFKYGKVEVRAKFNHGKGSWPAIWMMPEQPHLYGDWPNSGEIDIMEHVNNELMVHQTVHTKSETNADGASRSTHQSPYKINDFNIYGIIWDSSKIEFYLNGELQYTYNKVDQGTSIQWPFDVPFYIILNQSGGAGWPGKIDDKDLPFEMKIDYVKVYQLSE